MRRRERMTQENNIHTHTKKERKKDEDKDNIEKIRTDINRQDTT